MAAEMVAGAIVSEGVSKGISCVLGKRKDRVPECHNTERLEMALTTLGLALERSAKVPITDIWLIHRRMMLERAYNEAVNLLHRHKQQSLQQDQGTGGVTHSFFPKCWIARARKLSILFLLGLFGEGDSSCLSGSDLARFERFAVWADEFVKKVESGGISLWQHHSFRYPLERQLLEGKTLRYKMVKGGKSRHICIWPIFTEGRGVEVFLSYIYEDTKMPTTFFELELQLRISACTDIIGTAISCFQYLASQFKIVNKLALEEIRQLSDLQDCLSHSYVTPLEWDQEAIASNSKIFYRPNPICCTNNVVSSSVSSLGVPEPVIRFDFGCYVPAVECILPSSTDEVGMNSPPLYLRIVLKPHFTLCAQQNIIVKFEGKREQIGGSIQHMGAILRSRAMEFLVRQPADVDAEYHVYWNSLHGLALMSLERPSANPTWVRRPGWTRQKVIAGTRSGPIYPLPLNCYKIPIGTSPVPCCHRTAMKLCKFHCKLWSMDEDDASFKRDDSNEF